MHGRHDKRFWIRYLLAWVIGGLLLLPFSAMSGIYCHEDTKHSSSGVHCQHDGLQGLQAASDENDSGCCCELLFHVLGCQHHCQTAGQATLLANVAGGTFIVHPVWTLLETLPWQDRALPPPFHPPRP